MMVKLFFFFVSVVVFIFCVENLFFFFVDEMHNSPLPSTPGAVDDAVNMTVNNFYCVFCKHCYSLRYETLILANSNFDFVFFF